MGKIEKVRKFNKTWLNEPWAKGWLLDLEILGEGFCKLCKVNIRAHKADLIRHTKSKLHVKATSNLNVKPENQITNHIKIISNGEKAKDLVIAAHIATHCSVLSVDHLGELLNNLKITSKSNSIRQHRTKCTALIKSVISPSILEDLLEDLGSSKYSLILDESTDVTVKKYLCICIRYFSAKQNNIRIDFLGLVEVEKVTAEQLYLTLKNYLKTNNLDINNLIGIGTDGANNLCGKHNSLFTLLKSEVNPNLQLVKCICHSLNNASSKASEMLPTNLDFLCREIFNWFHCSPLRRAEYKHLYDTFNKNESKVFHNFVQLSATRWLCRYNVINIIIEQYEELQTYFNIIIDSERSYTVVLLKDMLNDKKTLLYLLIIKPVLYEINKVNIAFQKNIVEIGKAYSDVENLILFISKKIMKPLFTNSLSVVIKNLNNELAFLKPGDCNFGIEYYKTVRKYNLSPAEIEGLENRIVMYLKALLAEFVKRLPDNIEHFKKLEYFSPGQILSQTDFKKFEDLPFVNIFILEKDLYRVENQYNMLKIVQWKDIYGPDILNNSYQLWGVVKNHKDAGGNNIFTDLASFVFVLLSLPNSNATVERIFSIMNITKNKMRNRISLPLLNAIIRLKVFFYIEGICCNSFIPTKRMLQKFNNSMYLNKEPDEDVLCFTEVVEDNTEYPMLSVSD